MRLFLAALMLGTAAIASAAQPELEGKRDRQAQVQADTEQLARRVGTMLRVLDHYKLDQAAEKKLLADAADTLGGLSQGQMREVLDELDAAMKAADSDAAARLVDDAYAGHRDALRKLKGLLNHYDAIRDLDTAVIRLENMARDEVELTFRVGDILQDSLDSASTDPMRRKRGLRGEFPTTRARREVEEQNDQRRDLESVLKQIDGLRPSLKPDQLDRMAKALQVIRTADVVDKLRDAANRLQPEGRLADVRHRDWTMAGDSVWLAAGQLQEAAQALRAPRDPVQTLREARFKLVGLIDQLELEARTGTEFFAKPAEVAVDQPVARGFKNQAPEDPVLTKARTFADDQGRLAHAARAIRAVAAPQAPDAAKHLTQGAAAVRAASVSLRQVAPLFARGYQEWARSQFRTALVELDKAIAQAEKQRADPLAATQVALEKVERILQEQKQLHELTLKHDQSNNDEAAQKQAPKQNDLAKQALEVAQMPLPTGPRTQELLREATQAMHDAAKELAKPETKPAMEDQKEAIKRLEEAKKELTETAKNIEQRRDDMAALEVAKEKLDKLAKEQAKVAADAKAAAEKAKPNTQPVAKAQEKVSPPTKDVAKDLQQPAPDAAKMAKQAAEKMDAAKADLDKQMAKDAAPKAEQAKKDLDKASEMVAKALDQKRAQEALDQAKLQPNQIDPLQAAREVAKAMESTQEAAKNSEQAMQNPLTKDLIERQEKVAQQAQQMNQPKAADPAESAAKQLQKGDLQEAVNQQQKAMDQLQKAQAAMKADPAMAEQMKQAGEVAGEQKSIKEATEALAKSQEATQMAREAVQQALAQSPQAVQPQLDQAMKQLEQAGKDLQKSQPGQANQAQNQANQSLTEAMKALAEAAAMAAAEMPPPGQQPGEQPGQQPGQQPGEQPGQKPGQKPNKSQERNEEPGKGEREPDGAAKNAKAELRPGDADGNFLNLPPRQREMIKQALTDKLPPEYANLIQQYFVNISKGKPAAKPSAEPPREKK